VSSREQQEVVVSHIDADHITGVPELFDACDRARQDGTELPARPKRLWHNSFGGIVGAGPVLPKPAALTGADVGAEAEAIGASVPQGVALNDRARSLGVPVNDGHGGLIIAGDTTPNEFDLPGGPRLTVLHPNHERLERLRKLFEVTAQEHGDDAAVAAAMTDTSVPNLSSIVILASAKNATMLLTGDARGDDVLAGLDKAGKLDADKVLDSGRGLRRRRRAVHEPRRGGGHRGQPLSRRRQHL
jgi:hypothetical protein